MGSPVDETDRGDEIQTVLGDLEPPSLPHRGEARKAARSDPAPRGDGQSPQPLGGFRVEAFGLRGPSGPGRAGRAKGRSGPRRPAPRGEPHMEPQLGSESFGRARGGADASGESASRDPVMERSAEFETHHKLLLLETLYDAGLSLGSLPDEEALVEDVLGRAVGVRDAPRGYLATFGEGGARRAEARVGFPRRPTESVVAEDEFLRDLLAAETALR